MLYGRRRDGGQRRQPTAAAQRLLDGSGSEEDRRAIAARPRHCQRLERQLRRQQRCVEAGWLAATRLLSGLEEEGDLAAPLLARAATIERRLGAGPSVWRIAPEQLAARFSASKGYAIVWRQTAAKLSDGDSNEAELYRQARAYLERRQQSLASEVGETLATNLAWPAQRPLLDQTRELLERRGYRRSSTRALLRLVLRAPSAQAIVGRRLLQLIATSELAAAELLASAIDAAAPALIERGRERQARVQTRAVGLVGGLLPVWWLLCGWWSPPNATFWLGAALALGVAFWLPQWSWRRWIAQLPS